MNETNLTSYLWLPLMLEVKTSNPSSSALATSCDVMKRVAMGVVSLPHRSPLPYSMIRWISSVSRTLDSDILTLLGINLRTIGPAGPMRRICDKCSKLKGSLHLKSTGSGILSK